MQKVNSLLTNIKNECGKLYSSYDEIPFEKSDLFKQKALQYTVVLHLIICVKSEKFSNKQGTSLLMKRKKRYKIKYPNQPVWSCFAGFLRLIFKRPEIVNLAGELATQAIYVANHSAMAGPVVYNLYFPVPHAPWGAYPMLEGYKPRFRYLRNVYFVQKRKMNRAFASFLATFEACFSIWIYKGMHVIPSYPDGRFLKTLRTSLKTLKNNRAVMVFPERSETGYHETLTGFSAGFAVLAERYRKLYGTDIPIYPVYYHKKLNKMVVGKPHTISEFKDKNMSRKEIADEFCKITNRLFTDYVEPKREKQTNTSEQTGDVELTPLEETN